MAFVLLSFSKTAVGVKAVVLPSIINAANLIDAEVRSYYAGVEGKQGGLLSDALHDKIKNHTEFDYESETDRYAYKIIDRNWDLSPLSAGQLSSYSHVTDNPYIHKLYADYNNDADTADLFKNPGASRVSFDKEHIWAQSLGDFGRTGGAGSDFHHLWPSDVKGNQQAHSNYNFGVPTSNIKEVLNDQGSSVGRYGSIAGSSQKVFEPLDDYKGDIARAMFYMPVRYNLYTDALHPKLQLVNGSPSAVAASGSQAGLAGDLAALLSWNELDPVSDYEIRRNNLIYNNYQHNRNPFIDHPEWAKIVYDTGYSGSGADNSSGSSSVGSTPGWHSGAKVLDHLSVNASLARTTYYLNDEFSVKGLTVNAYYISAESKKLLSFDTSIANKAKLQTPGTHTVTVSYAEAGIVKSASYNITVADYERTLVSLTLDTQEVLKTFSFGDTFNTKKLKVTANYIDESHEDVTSVAKITQGDTEKIGIQRIYVSYGGMTVYYEIKVTNENAGLDIGKAEDLFISEYIEGSGYSKAVELYNGTGSVLNLTGYSLKLFSNGSATASSSLNLSGTLGNNSALVIYNSGSGSNIVPQTGYIAANSVINFNGDDAVALYKGNDLLDLIGEIGIRQSWTGPAGGGDATGATTDRTLVRISSIRQPNAVFTWSEWSSYAVDTFSYLGSHVTMYDSAFDYVRQASAYADYFLDVTSPYCEAKTGNDIPWTELSDEYGFMNFMSRNYFTDIGADEEEIIDAVSRYKILVDRYALLAANNFLTDGAGASVYFPSGNDGFILDQNKITLTIVVWTLVTVLFTIILLIFRKPHRGINRRSKQR